MISFSNGTMTIAYHFGIIMLVLFFLSGVVGTGFWSLLFRMIDNSRWMKKKRAKEIGKDFALDVMKLKAAWFDEHHARVKAESERDNLLELVKEKKISDKYWGVRVAQELAEEKLASPKKKV